MIVVICLVQGAYAQQMDSGVVRSAPFPASEETPAFDADAKDDPTKSVNWQDRMNVARQRHDDWLGCVRAKRGGCSPTSAPDPMDALLNDDTLVNGDVVSTPKGLRVFRGQSNAPHSLADFQ